MRTGERRYASLLLAVGGAWLLALAAAHGGLPPPPGAGPLLASAIGALAAASLAGSLGALAGSALAFSQGIEVRFAERALLGLSAVPSVVLGAALLWLFSDHLGAPPGLWLVALGLGILNLPHAVLRSAEVLRGHPRIADAARALGAQGEQVAEAVYGAARQGLRAVVAQAAGRSLGEAGLVALTAADIGDHGMHALTGGATLAARLWYLELQGKTASVEAFWPIAMLLFMAGALEWLFGRMEAPKREGPRD